MASGSDDVWALLQEIGQQQAVNLQLAEEQASIEHEIGVKESHINLKIPALKRKLESEKRVGNVIRANIGQLQHKREWLDAVEQAIDLV